jgi:tetratricopeptide (TPR) repeat protein
MKKLFYILSLFLLLLSDTYGKKDFYYSFVDDDLNQISRDQKKQVVGGSNRLKTIKRYIKEGQLNVALKQIELFKNSNKVGMLSSDIILLNSEILYKLDTKKRAIEADQMLEKAINNSEIAQHNLLEAYRLLVLIKIRINKIKQAQYYAKAIEYSFDDPLSKVYGKVARAQIYVKTRNYRKAIKILRKELIETTSLDVATIIADELYDAYILNKNNDKAYELVQKVLKKNINYYANDSYKALNKIDKLIKAGMPKFAINIIKKLLENASVTDSIDNFKFLLANTYMDLAGFEKKYMPMAKDIYEELIIIKENNPYLKRSKMILDEIIMREGRFDPQMISSKYSSVESMQYKTLMQELLNAIADEKYEQIIRMKKVYSGIYTPIINRFGYNNIEEVYNLVNSKMIKYYLTSNQCQQLNNVIKSVSNKALLLLIEDKTATRNLFNCMVELPEKRSYMVAKNVYSKSKNADVYFNLEKIAILLNNYKDAFLFSQKLDMMGDAKVLSDEFLYRFLIYGQKQSDYSMEKFFSYARENEEFIYNNKYNPLIIDFYYQYYLYLLKQSQEEEAMDILNKLYDKQNEMNARVYSPFVELELTKYAKLDDKYEKALKYLKHGLNIKRMRDGRSIDRKIKKDDLAHIYYEMAKIYQYLEKENRYKTMIKKCKNLKDIDSFYKKMCDKL